ncbi:Replication protein P [Vibrio aerogenes CECT 7868]|uniref:Replication protein P n=2 Tax=Vibrio aerogenes TaxID=92172 RepID=A0A1M6B702_9VIBR|nr:Replication protein P [Vibrio aerogenes CECT 7868]
MRNIAELAQQVRQTEITGTYDQPQAGQSQQSNTRQPVVSTQTARLVNHIFTELQVIFPAWRVAFPDKSSLNNAKRTWTIALFESRIYHTRQIELGLQKARQSGSPHVPSVGQFIRWCVPTCEALNLPTAEQAFAMIGDFRYEETRQHLPMVVQAAFHQIGHWDLTHLSQQKLFPVFQSHYDGLIRKVAIGEDISQLCPVLLPEPGERTLTLEEKERRRKAGLSKIQQLKQQYFGGNVHGN